MKNILIGLVVLVVVGVAGYFLFFSNKGSNQPVSTATQADLTGAKQINISAKEFSFTPSTINVTKGDKVAIIYKNDGTFSHNLTIADLGLATKTIASGETDTLVFTADRAGSFEFHCTVDSHKDRGMTGTLVVQ